MHDEYGHERHPSWWRPSVFDHVECIEHKLRQEEVFLGRIDVTETVDHRKSYKSTSGSYLLEVDLIERQIYLPDNFINEPDLREFFEACRAAEKELEAACPTT